MLMKDNLTRVPVPNLKNKNKKNDLQMLYQQYKSLSKMLNPF